MNSYQLLRREMDRLLSDNFGLLPRRLAFLPGRSARQYPLVNIYEEGDDFRAEALMPGIDPQKLEVTVVGNALTVAGEKPGLSDVRTEQLHRSERSAGRFLRTIQLPAEIDRERVSAEYRQGLLCLTLPRAESAKPRRIQIRSDGGGQQIETGGGESSLPRSQGGAQQ